MKKGAVTIKNLFLLSVLAAVFALSALPCIAQEQSKAVLSDTFGGGLSNDDLLARVDNYSRDLSGSNSRGYIIAYGTKENPLAKYMYERRLRGCFKWGRYSTDNVVFAFGEDKDEIKIELWKLPAGAEKPEFIESGDYNLSAMTASVMIHQNTGWSEYCPAYFDMEFYSRFLKATPDLTGKIVIREKTPDKYNKEKNKYLRELTETNKISPKQLKFVRAKYKGEPDAEFWLIPKK